MISRITLLALLALTLAAAACMVPLVEKDSHKESLMHYKLGLSYLEENKYQGAFLEFQKALEANPNNKDIHNALGFVYMKFEDMAKAKASFERAVSLDPSFSDSYNNLCIVHYKMKQYKEAASYCKKALDNLLYTTPEKAFYNLGLIHYRQKNYEESVKAYKQAVIRQDGFYPAHYGLALAYNALSQYGAASAALEKAIKLDPSFKGSADKAEREFMDPANPNPRVESEDVNDILEILRY